MILVSTSCLCMKQNFDAVIDVTIISYRYQYAEFTQPYTDPGVVMVVPLKSKLAHRTWLFIMIGGNLRSLLGGLLQQRNNLISQV